MKKGEDAFPPPLPVSVKFRVGVGKRGNLTKKGGLCQGRLRLRARLREKQIEIEIEIETKGKAGMCWIPNRNFSE